MNLKSFVRPAVFKKEAYFVSEYTCPIKLNQNENPYSLPEPLMSEVLELVRNESFNRYPTVFPEQLISELAKKHNISSDMILVGHGSNELIYSSFWALLEKNDSFLISVPSFKMYESVAELCEASVYAVHADKETLLLDVDLFIDEIKKQKPKLTVVCSPNNPSSQRIMVHDLIRIIEAAPGLVWLDEAYIEFSENQSLLGRINEFKNLVILRTFSKAFALAGLRLGYIVAHPELIEELKKTKVPFTVDHLSQSIALKILNDETFLADGIKKIKHEKSRLFHQLTTIENVRVFESDTNFFIFRIKNVSAKTVFEQLAKEGVLVRDVGSYPLMENCLRVTVGTPQENDDFIMSLTKIMMTETR